MFYLIGALFGLCAVDLAAAEHLIHPHIHQHTIQIQTALRYHCMTHHANH